jgi:hypothetical protein
MLDRLVLGLTTLFVSPHRIPKLSAILKPATLFKFHKALVHRKCVAVAHKKEVHHELTDCVEAA